MVRILSSFTADAAKQASLWERLARLHAHSPLSPAARFWDAKPMMLNIAKQLQAVD